MWHWLDLRPYALSLERLAYTNEAEAVFTAFDSEETLKLYRATGGGAGGAYVVEALSETPLTTWGAPGLLAYFHPVAYQVMYAVVSEALVTRILAIENGQTQCVLSLNGEYTIAWLDDHHLLAFPVILEGEILSETVLAFGLSRDLDGLNQFVPLVKAGCFERWPVLSPREPNHIVSKGWTIWEDCLVEDYQRAESALTGGSQPDENLWSVQFQREGQSLIGYRMPLYTAGLDGWTRSVGLDAKGRFWYRTGLVVGHQVSESLWRQDFSGDTLKRPVACYKRQGENMTTSAYDSHQFAPIDSGFALLQTKRAGHSFRLQGLYGSSIAFELTSEGAKTHFEGFWQGGVLLSQWLDTPTEEGNYERVLYAKVPSDGGDWQWEATEGASCTLKDKWCILCSKSW